VPARAWHISRHHDMPWPLTMVVRADRHSLTDDCLFRALLAGVPSSGDRSAGGLVNTRAKSLPRIGVVAMRFRHRLQLAMA